MIFLLGFIVGLSLGAIGFKTLKEEVLTGKAIYDSDGNEYRAKKVKVNYE